jgi:hypothetical protein
MIVILLRKRSRNSIATTCGDIDFARSNGVSKV